MLPIQIRFIDANVHSQYTAGVRSPMGEVSCIDLLSQFFFFPALSVSIRRGKRLRKALRHASPVKSLRKKNWIPFRTNLRKPKATHRGTMPSPNSPTVPQFA